MAIPRLFTILKVLALAGLCLVTPVRLPAAEPADPPEPPHPALALPSGPRSPVDFFRQLLALAPEERAAALAQKTPDQRETLLAKVEEYNRMNPQEREIRFRLLEVRLYTLRMLNASADRRAALVEEIPAHLRERIASRVKEWDTLAAGQQQQVLRDELSLHVFLYRGYGSAQPDEETLRAIMPPSRRQQVETSMAQWRSLSEQERQDLARRMANLLKLHPQQQVRVLKTVPPAERVQMEMVLRRYARLSAEQRERCLDGFSKLAELTEEERRSFLLQARVWQEMSPEQRDLFRALAHNTTSPSVLPPFPSPP